MQSQTNTFQVVIATDGRNSFVLFLYPEDGLTWSVGDNKYGSDKVHAQVGFDNADGSNYHALPSSGSVDVVHLSR